MSSKRANLFDPAKMKGQNFILGDKSGGDQDSENLFDPQQEFDNPGNPIDRNIHSPDEKFSSKRANDPGGPLS